MTELMVHDPFVIPDEMELENEVHRPKWWYAAQLRLAGAEWGEIAAALGYQDGDSAKKAVSINKRKRDKQELSDIVDLELDRLDALQLSCWRMAQAGNSKAVANILAIMQMRMRLLGTEKKPGEAPTTQNTAIFIGGTEQEYRAALRKAREAIAPEVIDHKPEE